jgi:hypothetical protein
MHKILIYLHIIHLLKSSTCFEHYSAHLQEVYIVTVYMQPPVSLLSAGGCRVHRLRKKLFFLSWCIGQPPAESDDTGGCIYTVTAIVYVQPPVSSLSAGVCPVHRLRKNLFFLNRWTGQPPAESDDTGGCIYTITA